MCGRVGVGVCVCACVCAGVWCLWVWELNYNFIYDILYLLWYISNIYVEFTLFVFIFIFFFFFLNFCFYICTEVHNLVFFQVFNFFWGWSNLEIFKSSGDKNDKIFKNF